jgi:hypothetical protein
MYEVVQICFGTVFVPRLLRQYNTLNSREGNLEFQTITLLKDK